FPLDEGTGLLFFQRPPEEAALSEPVTIYPGTPTLEPLRSGKLILGRSFRVTVRLAYRPGDEGVLLAHGDQSGGYVLYIEDGALKLFFHALGHTQALAGGGVPTGAREVVLDAAAGENTWTMRLL